MAYQDIILADTPISYWRLEGATAYNEIGGTTTTKVGTPSVLAGKVNNGWKFNKTQVINLAGHTNFVSDNTFSIETWFRIGNTSARLGWPTIYWNSGTGGTVAIQMSSANGELAPYIGGQTAYYGSWDDDLWHHLVMTVNGTGAGAVKIYVDNVQVGTLSNPGSLSNGATAHVIGSVDTTPTDADGAWDGYLDEFAIYNYALTGAQIQTHYNSAMGIGNAGYTAQPMTASADAPGGTGLGNIYKAYVTDDASVNTGSPDTNFGTVDPLQINTVIGTQAFIKLPAYPGTEVITSKKLKFNHGYGPFTQTFKVYTVAADWSEGTITWNNKPATTLVKSITVTTTTNYEPFTLDLTDVDTTNGVMLAGPAVSPYSSDNATVTNRPETIYTTAVQASVSHAAAVATATAAMPDPVTSTTKTVSASGQPMTASATMPNSTVVTETFIDVSIAAGTMDALVEITNSGFAVPAGATAEALLASADTVTPAVTTTKGVIFKAAKMTATAVWNQPATINGNPIVASEVEDNYFQRVYSRTPKYWLRLTESNGVTTAKNRMGGTDMAIFRDGVQAGRFDAPDGRHSVHFVPGSYIEQIEPSTTNDDEKTGYSGARPETTLEFAFRTTKANAFLMAGRDLSQSTNIAQAGWNSGHELFLKDGKISVRQHTGDWDLRWGPRPDPTEFTAFRDLADGEWHHVVIKKGIYNFTSGATGIEIWIDGTMEIRRYRAYTAFVGFPDYIGTRPAIVDGVDMGELPSSQDFEGDMAEISFSDNMNISKKDIARDYYAFMGWTPIETDSAEAFAFMPAETRGKGNQKRALYLYWNNVDETLKEGGILHGPAQTSFDPLQGALNGFWGETTLDYGGYKVFVKGVIFNSQGTYRDPVTDEQSLINLEHDVDLKDYDMIMFKDWPDEGSTAHNDATELDAVDFYWPGQKERLLNQLRAANDMGIGLYVTNPRLAVDLGIIDKVDLVPDLMEHRYVGGQGAAQGLYDYGSAVKFPWNIDAYDGLSGAAFAVGIGDTQNLDPLYLDGKAFFYHDTNCNNRFRVRALVEGLTDIPSWMLDEAAFHRDYDEWGWSGAAFKYLKREDGLHLGDEFIYYGSQEIPRDKQDGIDNRYGRFYGVYAAPVSAVKAGTVVTTFGATHWKEKSIVTNPYQDHATTIVVQPGDTLAGRPVGGKIFVNFTERPTQGLGVAYQILPDGENGVEWPYGGASSPWPETEAQQEWDYSWTRVTLRSTSEQSPSEWLSVVLPNGEASEVQLEQKTSETLTMTRSSQLFEIAAKPRMEMTARGLMWLYESDVVSDNDAVIRATPMTANGEMNQPVTTAQRDNNYVAQAAQALAQMPKVAEDATGEVEIRTLPMTAEATFTGYGKTISVSPMTATAELVEDFNMVHATGEQVVLTLHGVGLVTLYLKEEA